MKEFFKKNKDTIYGMIGGAVLLFIVEQLFEYFFGIKLFGIFNF